MAHISNDFVKIHYEVEGNGDCLVFQHGFLGSIEDWEYSFYKRSQDVIKVLDAIHPYVSDMISMRNLVRTLDEWAQLKKSLQKRLKGYLPIIGQLS